MDWLQDDDLGSAVTDSNGRFRIDYTSADFKKDILGLNIELFGSPDLYFKVETLEGAPLLSKPPAKGRTPGRENAGPCTCVELCVDHAPPEANEPVPAFVALGDYDFAPAVPAIHAAVPGSGLTVGDNRAFYSNIRLNGILSKKLNGAAMEYRFEVRTTQPNGTPIGAWTAVAPNQFGPVAIGHPELGTVSVSMTGPGGPYSFVTPASVPGECFGSCTQFSADSDPAHTPILVKNLQPCGYLLTLSTPLLMTTGDSIPAPLQDQIVFCKK